MEPVTHAPPHSFFPPTTTTTTSSSSSSRIVVPTAHRFPNPQLRQTDGTNDNDSELRSAKGEHEEREVSSLNREEIDRLFEARVKQMRNEKGRKGIDKTKEGGGKMKSYCKLTEKMTEASR
jgi:hypothetical protein